MFSFRPLSRRIRFRKILNTAELAVFTRQLSTLLGARLPLLRSLEILIRQEKKAFFKKVLIDLTHQVRSGNFFAESLARHPEVFDRFFVNTVKAGEASGRLDEVLERLARFTERSVNTKNKVVTAMIYPSVVLVMAGCIIVLLMLLVVPKFQQVYQDMLRGAPLPQLTSFIILVSAFVQRHFIAIVLGISTVGLCAVKFLSSSHTGKRVRDWFWMHVPRVNALMSKANIARFTRTFGILLANGIPLLESLIITRGIIDNTYFARALDRMYNRICDGQSIAASLEHEKIFPDSVVSMVDVGEETGDLPGMLNRIADDYDEEVERSIAGFTALIEPTMIVALALVIGGLVVALFLPIVEMIDKLS